MAHKLHLVPVIGYFGYDVSPDGKLVVLESRDSSGTSPSGLRRPGANRNPDADLPLSLCHGVNEDANQTGPQANAATIRKEIQSVASSL